MIILCDFLEFFSLEKALKPDVLIKTTFVSWCDLVKVQLTLFLDLDFESSMEVRILSPDDRP